MHNIIFFLAKLQNVLSLFGGTGVFLQLSPYGVRPACRSTHGSTFTLEMYSDENMLDKHMWTLTAALCCLLPSGKNSSHYVTSQKLDEYLKVEQSEVLRSELMFSGIC